MVPDQVIRYISLNTEMVSQDQIDDLHIHERCGSWNGEPALRLMAGSHSIPMLRVENFVMERCANLVKVSVRQC